MIFDSKMVVLTSEEVMKYTLIGLNAKILSDKS